MFCDAGKETGDSRGKKKCLSKRCRTPNASVSLLAPEWAGWRCAHKNLPYVVPIYFVYEDPYLYGFTTLGQKVEWMRSNPQVCVELDEIVNGTQWMSIVIFGRYQELPDAPENVERWNHHRHIPFKTSL